MNTWEEIYEWFKESANNELFFTKEDDVISALNYIREHSADLYLAYRTYETVREWISGEYTEHYEYLSMWIDTLDDEVVIGLRNEDDIYRYNVKFYNDSPFLNLNIVDIDIDALNSLF